MTDFLTGLDDRWQFIDYLHEKVSRCKTQQKSFALLVIEIKNFQQINLLHGHVVGDQLLKKFTGVLKEVARNSDSLFRLGDRKFSLVLRGIKSIEHAKLAAYKVQRLLETIFKFDSTQVRCVATVGIALFPDNSSEADTLFQHAEIALNQAKQLNLFIGVVDGVKQEPELNIADLEVDLMTAIESSELRVFFQPKISATTGQPLGAEALVRWQHPVHGLLTPYHFLPIATTSGLLKPLTIWVLNAALRLSRQWSEKWGDLKLSVNIPTLFIEQADFIDVIKSAQGLWQKSGIILCLELLEDSFMSNADSSFKVLKDLQAEGIKISIDDFGTGYSSLAYFMNIPADELKIDQSFILGLTKDLTNLKIINLITDLAHSFGLTVVAEGVENEEIVKTLKQVQCDEYQGYYYARPLPADEFETWLETYVVK